MTTDFSPSGHGSRRSTIGLIVAALAGLVVVSLLDRTLYFALRWESSPGERRLEIRDWYQFLRQVGYLPAWLVLAAAVALFESKAARRAGAGRPADGSARRRAAALALAPMLAGVAAEMLKLVIGRERPEGPDGVFQGYVFRPLLDGFRDGSNLGLPSSHAAVAFGGAFVLARIFPGVGPVAVAMAAGCGLTRLLAGAHFASDVFAAAVIAYACAAGVARLLRLPDRSCPPSIDTSRGPS